MIEMRRRQLSFGDGSPRLRSRSLVPIARLFEPSTEVIRKGKAGKPNEFGKMVKLHEAENQIITDTAAVESSR
jgi:hypothetical protein